MNELEKLINKLQNSSHHTKRLIMWTGVPVIMVIVVFIWLTYSNFGYTDESASAPVAAEGPSNFEIFKNGLNISIKEIQSLIQSVKDKMGRTNSFDIKTSESTATTSLDISEASSTQENIQVGTTTPNNQ
jgi:ABC-type cobalt transport system substrate-binding protein